MAFKCVSRDGLSIGCGYLPKEIQELIANFWLPNRYREKYDDVMRELVVELAVGSAMPINNIEPTKVQILLAEFNNYDKNTMQIIMKLFYGCDLLAFYDPSCHSFGEKWIHMKVFCY